MKKKAEEIKKKEQTGEAVIRFVLKKTKHTFGSERSYPCGSSYFTRGMMGSTVPLACRCNQRMRCVENYVNNVENRIKKCTEYPRNNCMKTKL